MRGLLLKNATVLDYFPLDLAAEAAPRVETVDFRLSGERISERGHGLTPREGEEVRDLTGVTVVPGNINAHGHLYASLAAGMPSPRVAPGSFTEILAEIWWPLDRSLDAEANYLSAVAGSWDALRCGTTLIFDHHASLSAVGESLDRIEQGIREVGLRGCLCYETSDRSGKGLRDTTLDENERYLQKLSGAAPTDVPQFKGLVGAHASFTLEDVTLGHLADLCERWQTGLHIHLAEGTTDREVSRKRGWPSPLQRLDEAGLLRPGSILAHGVDLGPAEMQVVQDSGAWLIHCGRSNMNTGVGRAPVDRFPANCGLGSDGLDNNIWGELRTSFFRGNEGGRGPLCRADAARFWLGNFRLAREIFAEPFGCLDVGAPADFVILENFQKTPLTSDTWLNHLLFNFHPWDIHTVVVGGRIVYRSGDAPPVDPLTLQATARRMWESMGWHD